MIRRIADWTLPAAVALISLACIAGLCRIVATIGLKVPFDPNEGWNAYHAVRAMMTGSPYPSPDSFMTNNYPPLSFHLVGLFGRFFGDMIIAGRVVSLASFIAIFSGIAAVLRMMACSALECAFGALIFAACLLLNSDYVGMDDPQLLGHAVAMAGLLVTLREPRRPLALVSAALLFTLAFFIKHNLVIAPIALTAWLGIYERRRAIWLGTSGLVCFVAGLVLFRLGYGFGLLGELQSSRLFSFHDLVGNLETWLIWGLLPLVVAATLAITRRGDKWAMFCAVYAFSSFLFVASYFGGAGVDVK